MAVAPKRAKITTDDNHEYKCLRCGKVSKNADNVFPKVRWSELYKANDFYVPLCKDCVDDLFDIYSRRYRSDKKACLILCYMLDIPFYNALFDSVIEKNTRFTMGLYTRNINGKQYNNKTFAQTILEGELNKSGKDIQDEKESKWTDAERRNMQDTIEIVGYDPFEGFNNTDRRFLFGEIVKYFDDDVADDQYKLSQVIQLVINNNQVRQYDLLISGLNPLQDAAQIEALTKLKSSITSTSKDIAKENEISVKNRSNKAVGKSTLTYLMRDMREKGIEDIEENFYDVLKSPGTQWAVDMSMKSLKANAMFDENDQLDIISDQRQMIVDLQSKLDDIMEEKRLLALENVSLKAEQEVGDSG